MNLSTPKHRDIIIEIDEHAEIKVTTKGFTGKSCMKETEFLEAALGKKTTTQLTPAYYDDENGVRIKKHLPLCG